LLGNGSVNIFPRRQILGKEPAALRYITLLGPVFTDISDINISMYNCPIVTPDNYHSPTDFNFKLTMGFSHISLTSVEIKIKTITFCSS
jgi:hypothetical protein